MKHTVRIQALFVRGLFLALMLCGIPADAASDFARATPHGGAWCPEGSFLDLGRGQCWSCPKGYSRFMLSAVDAANACERLPYLLYKRAARHGRGTGLLGTDCPRGQFWDLKGYCYSCPDGYIRGSASVTSSQACLRPVSAAYARATRRKDFGCPKGTFLDIGRGDCWSCPANWYRTALSPVDGARACTNSVTSILAADPTATCSQVVTAFAEGEKGVALLMDTIRPAIDLVLEPANDGLRALSRRIATPAELDGLVDTLAKSLRPYGGMVEEVQRLSNQLRVTGPGLKRLLLDPTVMCRGTPAETERRLEALGLRPNWRIPGAGSREGRPVGHGHAATKSAYVAFTTSVSFASPGRPGPSVVLSLATNFEGSGGVFLSFGPSMVLPGALAAGVQVSFGFLVFPRAELADFAGGSLAAEVSLGAGEPLKKLLEKAGAWKVAIPDTFSVSFDPEALASGKPERDEAASWPGFGFSKDPTEPEQSHATVFTVGCSFDVTWEITTW